MTLTRISRRFLAVAVVAYFPAWASARSQSPDPAPFAHSAWAGHEGLTGGVRAFAQTPDGYLWVGTEFGLVRFDGLRLVHWSAPQGQSLPSTRILSLLAARDSTLWIGTFGGLASWRGNRLVRYPELSGEPVVAILEDHDRTIWVALSRRLCTVRGEKVQCRHDASLGLRTHDNNAAGIVYSIYEDEEHRLWVGAGSGVWRLTSDSLQLALSQPVAAFQAFARGNEPKAVVVITGAREGRLLREITSSGTREYTPADVGRLRTPNRLLRDRSGALWIGTLDQGLVRVQEGRPTTYFGTRDGLSSDFVIALFEDREGNVWVGTTSGFDRFRRAVASTLSTKDGLPTPASSVLSARDGSVWIGTEGGLSRWRQQQLTVYRSTKSAVARGRADDTTHVVAEPALPEGRIGSLVEDARGRILITGRNSAAWFDDGRFMRATGIRVDDGSNFAADSRGGVWIANADRALIRVVDGKTVDSVPVPWPTLGFGVRVSAVIADPVQGGVWLGGIAGHLVYVRDGEIRQSLGTSEGLGPHPIWSLRVDRDGTVWAATEGGLSRIRNGRAVTLTTSNGLPCGGVRALIVDDAGDFWLYVTCGVVRIERGELSAWEADSNRVIHARLFDGGDGVRTHVIITQDTPAATKSQDGGVWFVHGDGVSAIDPRHLPFNTLPPPVHIEQITADGTEYARAPGLRLPPRVHDLSINYTALSLAAPEKVRFRFKLEGQDRGWREVVNRRDVQYSNLAPRTYRFRVIASNENGVWNEQGDALEFSVAPAFFQTHWFRALIACGFAWLLWVLFRWRVGQLQREEVKFRDTVEAIPAMAFTAMPSGDMSFLNRRWADYTGLGVDDAIGKGWQKAVFPGDLERIRSQWQGAVSSGKPLEYEVRLRAASGEFRSFLTRVVAVRDKHGNVVRWYGVNTDIEDRKRAEHERERLRELEADLAHVNRVSTMGELTASLAHEIRQPIAAAMLNANAALRWIDRDQPNLQEAREAATRILSEGARANEIIERLRSLYKKTPTQREIVDVNDIIREILVVVRGEATRYSLSIRVELAEGLPSIVADRVQLQQVFMNLMLNGIEAMKDTGGQVVVTSQRSGNDTLLFTVEDSGVGLPPEMADEIFAPFFTTKPHGSGMGLSITRSIVESHGGRIWATPNDGAGAIFCFTLPMHAGEFDSP